MAKVRNVSHGIYADGKLFVEPGEVIEVKEEQAKYLCDENTAGKFERVVDEKPAAAGGAR
jgi:hypothetical protein